MQEARNLTEFAVAHSYLGFVDTPHVIWPLTTTRQVEGPHGRRRQAAALALEQPWLTADYYCALPQL